jgi:hypothetical protein
VAYRAPVGVPWHPYRVSYGGKDGGNVRGG